MESGGNDKGTVLKHFNLRRQQETDQQNRKNSGKGFEPDFQCVAADFLIREHRHRNQFFMEVNYNREDGTELNHDIEHLRERSLRHVQELVDQNQRGKSGEKNTVIRTILVTDKMADDTPGEFADAMSRAVAKASRLILADIETMAKNRKKDAAAQ